MVIAARAPSYWPIWTGGCWPRTSCETFRSLPTGTPGAASPIDEPVGSEAPPTGSSCFVSRRPCRPCVEKLRQETAHENIARLAPVGTLETVAAQGFLHRKLRSAEVLPRQLRGTTGNFCAKDTVLQALVDGLSTQVR